METTEQFPKRIEIAYNDALDSLRFFKTQEWQITRYVLLVDAALFVLKVTLKSIAIGSQILALNCVLFTALIVASGFGIAAIISTEASIARQRRRLKWIYKKYFSDEEINGLELRPGVGAFNQIGFTVCFCVTIFVGTLISALAIFQLS